MPSTLEKFGLTHALRELCERFQDTSKITIQFFQHEDFKTLDKTRELMIFRVVQELLNNAIKHSQATEITVSLSAIENVQVSVEDNGIGFDAEAFKKDTTSGKGLGLFNIENRTRLLGAKLEYEKGRRQGSKTIITLPKIHEKA